MSTRKKQVLSFAVPYKNRLTRFTF